MGAGRDCARSRETIPATFAICLLASGDPVQAVEQGANFGRDSDTIATMAGAICGALAGAATIPPSWEASVGSHTDDAQGAMAASLVKIAREKARTETIAWSGLL